MKTTPISLFLFTLFALFGAGAASGQIEEAPRYEAGSVDALRRADASRFADGASVWLRGYREAGDGGQGRFYLDRSGDLGADAANGGTIIEAKGGESWYWRRYHSSGVYHAAWFGVLPDGGDVQPTLERVFRLAAKAVEQPLIRIDPGRYHLAEPLRVNHEHLSIEGAGAIFDNTIHFRRKYLWVKGLTVEGVKDGPGFHWHRAQMGVFVNLTARRCRDGFLLGGNQYNQVTLGTFIQPAALHNERHGFVLDGGNGKNWVNQNVLLHPISRDNGGDAFITRAQTNYNAFIGAQAEGNGGIAVRDKGLENAWFAGHFVDMEEGVAFDGHWRSALFGGRSRGDVAGANTVLMRSPIAPKARRLDNMFRITVDNLQVKGRAEIAGMPKRVSGEAIEEETAATNYNSGKDHRVMIDLEKAEVGDTPFFDVIVQGAANRHGRIGQNFHLRAGASVFGRAGSDSWAAKVEPQQESGCQIVKTYVSEDNKLVIRFKTEALSKIDRTRVFAY